ncbi:MAG: NfeD family protein [Tenericutes bacterium]|nr:NfeD family protein [Mycoplasmatota bacterium]
MEFMVWMWLGLFIAAIVVEFATSDLVSIWFALAAVPSFIMALLRVNIVVQVVVFVLIAVLLLLLTRPFVMKYFKTNEIKTNVDSYVGATGVVTKTITPDTIGRVQVKNGDWSAISHDTLEVGTKIRVLDIEGAKLIVETIEK